MTPFRRYLAIAMAFLLLSAGARADIRINLVKGKRTIKDQVSFTIEVTHEKNEDPPNQEKPEFIEFSASFAKPASGTIALDGKGVERFDSTVEVKGERTEITYGRHVVTVQVSEPAVATSLVAFVRGGVVREVIGEELRRPAASAQLERRVKELEAELEGCRKAQRNR